LGTQQSKPADWFYPISLGKQDISQRALAQGIEDLQAPYKRLRDAAKQCGTEFFNHFSVCNKMLSKFVHPTAMQIIGEVDEAKRKLQTDVFFSYGCLFFTGGFSALEEDSQTNQKGAEIP
jgi:hypothetical protein